MKTGDIKELEAKVAWLWMNGYSYAEVGSYALQWDCSLTEAIDKLFDLKHKE